MNRHRPGIGALTDWLSRLETNDPELYRDLVAGKESAPEADAVVTRAKARRGGGVGVALETAFTPPKTDDRAVLETIVRKGRPSLFVRDDKVTEADSVIDGPSGLIMSKLRKAESRVNTVIPLVGRIDVAGYPGGVPYLGTGWLIDRNVVVTNRHVARLIARQGSTGWVFRPSPAGGPIGVSINYRHESKRTASEPVKIKRVIYIEENDRRADFALLEVEAGSSREARSIPLAASDAAPNADVAVVGYPAQADAETIPNQKWMEQIFRGTYDVKRVAPGVIGQPSSGWATHDCTTLGGNSGSVVIDLASGEAVGLHFAGLYMVENYAVPASTLRGYLKDRPWHGAAAGRAVRKSPPPPAAPVAVRGAAAGKKHVEAVRAMRRQVLNENVLSIRPGFVLSEGRITDTPAIVIGVQPAQLSIVSPSLPTEYAGFPVEVRPASLYDQLTPWVGDVTVESTTDIEYNDADRTGDGFSFAWVNEQMDVLAHVGPERSWTVLSDFLAKTKTELVSSMYQFLAPYIIKAVSTELDEDAKMTLVVAPQSKEKAATFTKWAHAHDAFKHIFVPVGSGGLVKNAYHIKVTVRDRRHVWLSSGNWSTSSQPNIPKKDLKDPKKTTKAGNREWHIVLENKKLADRFRNHILADFAQSKKLGESEESVLSQLMVDVPAVWAEAVVLEAAATQVFEPLAVSGKIRVKPLLTPDGKSGKHGSVFSEAALDLVENATRQIVFQNQYIKVKDDTTGFLDELVNALVKQSRKKSMDVRLIIRSEGSGLVDDVSELKRRGMDTDKCVKRIPKTHTKGIVVDGEKVLIGSQNWSADGVSVNRDASLLFDNKKIAQYFLDVFTEDWNRATDIALEGVVPEGTYGVDDIRIADGPVPPPGYIRMSLEELLEG